jgi:hypothetical protein
MFKHATEAYDETATNAERIRLEELAAKQELYSRVEPEQIEKIRAAIDDAVSKGRVGVEVDFDTEVSPKISKQLLGSGYKLHDFVDYLETGTVYRIGIYWNKR